MSTRRRFFLRGFVLLLIAALVAGAGYYFYPPRTHVVSAQLRIRDALPLLQTASDDRAISTSAEERDRYAATCIELLCARSVLTEALRSDKVRELGVVRSHENFENTLKRELQISRPSPSIIEVSLPCYEADGADYQCVVDAVVRSFIANAERRDLESQAQRQQQLNKIRSTLLDKQKREMDTLESLKATLGHGEPNVPTAFATNRHLTRGSEALIDALAKEIASLKVSLIVDGDYEQQTRLDTLNRLEGEYIHQIQKLVDELTNRVEPTPRKFVTVELKQRDIDRLQQHIDEISDSIFRAEMDLEKRGRLELLSTATLTQR